MEDGDIRHRETPAFETPARGARIRDARIRDARIRDARTGRLYMSYASI